MKIDFIKRYFIKLKNDKNLASFLAKIAIIISIIEVYLSKVKEDTMVIIVILILSYFPYYGCIYLFIKLFKYIFFYHEEK